MKMSPCLGARDMSSFSIRAQAFFRALCERRRFAAYVPDIELRSRRIIAFDLYF